MATVTEIPVLVNPQAAVRVSQLGMESELQLMTEHARLTISDLVALEVETWDDEFEPGQPHLCLVAWHWAKLYGLSKSGCNHYTNKYHTRTFS